MTDTISLRDLCNAPECREWTFVYIEKCPDCNNKCKPNFKLLKIDEIKKMLNVWEDRLVVADENDPTALPLIDKLSWCNWISITPDLSWWAHKVKICFDPSKLNIKFTDLLDWPWDYWVEKCWETDCDNDPDCPCENSTCIGAVLMPKCDGTWVERRCLSQLLIWETRTELSRQEYTLSAELEWPQVEIWLEINAQTWLVPDAQAVYISWADSQRINITKAWRYQIDWQVQYAVNKYVNAVRFWVYNWTTWQEVCDFKYGWRLNNWYTWITWYDTSYWLDPTQDVNTFNKNMYMLHMFWTAQANTHMWLEEWEYSIVMKMDTRTDNTWTEIWRVTVLWKNWDTVINEWRWALTYLRISEMWKYNINVCE